MAQGWRRRLLTIGCCAVLSSGPLGCMKDDKKTLPPPPLSKAAMQGGARTSPMPGAQPAAAPVTPVGSRTSSSFPTAPGAQASAPGSFSSLNSPAPSAQPLDTQANPNNTGAIGRPANPGAIGVGAPIPGTYPTSAVVPATIPEGPIAPKARAASPSTSTPTKPDSLELPFVEGLVPPPPPTIQGSLPPVGATPEAPSPVVAGPLAPVLNK